MTAGQEDDVQASKATLPRLHLFMLCGVLLFFTACGSESNDPPSTSPPTVVTTATSEPTPAEKSEEGGGVVRTIRSAPGAVLDGISWVWDRGSDGVNAVWDGLRSAGGFLWDRVTGLPSTIADVFRSAWRLIKSSGAGELARQTVEQIKSLNPGSLFDRLMQFLRELVVGLLRIVSLIALIVLVIFGVLRWGLWMHLARLFWGGAEKGLAKIPTPGTTTNRHSASTVKRTVERTDRGREPAGLNSSSVDFGHVRVGTSAGEGWSPEQVHEIRERTTNQTIIVLFGQASGSDGHPVNDVELMRATGRSIAQLGADFSSFTRLCKEIHPTGERIIEAVAPTMPGAHRAYTVPDQYLEWWFGE